jgi:hypothetical protein
MEEDRMQFALLIYGPEQKWADASAEERKEVYERYGAFQKLLMERDAIRGGAQLGLTRTASTVRKRETDVLVTDGPFAETVEQLAGFIIVEAPDQAAALEYAKAMPARTVEVRALVEPEEEVERARST